MKMLQNYLSTMCCIVKKIHEYFKNCPLCHKNKGIFVIYCYLLCLQKTGKLANSTPIPERKHFHA